MNVCVLTMMLVRFALWFGTFTPAERIALTAAFLVFIGVAGEYVIEIPEIEKRERLRARIKRFAMAVLLLGLAGDVLGIVMSQSEMAALTQEAGDAKNSATEAAKASTSAQADAKTAREEADAAKSASKDAKDEAGTAKTIAGLAIKESKSASDMAVDAKGKVDKAENDLVNLNFKIEQQRVHFDELSQALAPRELWIVWYKDRTSNLDRLKDLTGISIFVESIPEFEAEFAASQIMNALKEAKLNPIPRQSSTPLTIPEGVTIERYSPASGDTAEAFFGGTRRTEIVEAFLLQNHWDANSGPPNKELTPDSIVIRVGYKPNPYFEDPKMKELEKAERERVIKEFGFDATGKQVAARYKIQPGQRLSYQIP